MNLILKQHRYMMTGYKIRIGVVPKKKPSILFIERGKKQSTIGTNHLMHSG